MSLFHVYFRTTTEYVIDGRQYGNLGRFFDVRTDHRATQCRVNLFSNYFRIAESIYAKCVYRHTRRSISAISVFHNTKIRGRHTLDYKYEVGSIPNVKRGRLL